MGGHVAKQLIPLQVAVLTVSDTRDESTDTSGQTLVRLLTDAGHTINDKVIIKDDIYQIRAHISRWIASDTTQVVLVTGGTGFTGRDSTPEAVTPLLDKIVEGFGEVFRAESMKKIGTSTIQSRALAGLSNGTLIFCMPGSTGACKDAWEIIESQIDARHAPCNFVPQLKNIDVELCFGRD
ncbi:MAG: molybdenum cofactor biosynthesis protein B [Candidatus Pelagadaptatus aseana]|uniref:molybdenum cofactor biosynthesis protein B n=1 Tax=Candidatus Pelagadaptatus aseana TaxID=3120508 RepID=UPI0039B3302F